MPPVGRKRIRPSTIIFFPMPQARKKCSFALGRPENGASEDQKRAKSVILRSEGQKMALRRIKSAQKVQFCARKALKVPCGSPKARKMWVFALGRAGNGSSESQNEDKNLNFVLERAQNLAKVDSKRTKWALLSSKAPKMAVLEGKKGQKPQFCPRTGPKTSKS